MICQALISSRVWSGCSNVNHENDSRTSISQVSKLPPDQSCNKGGLPRLLYLTESLGIRTKACTSRPYSARTAQVH